MSLLRVEPDRALLEVADQFDRVANLAGPRSSARATSRNAARRLREIAQAHAELAAGLAHKVRECAALRARLEALGG